VDLLVLAKEPLAGRVKTRLCPPCTPDEAAAVAEAALADTLQAATAAGADRVVLSLDGRPGSWCPPGVEVVPQGEGTLADRLAATWRHAAGPALQIGMDTPQVTGAELAEAMAGLVDHDRDGDGGGHEAVLGLADDGGWWAIGFRGPCPHDAFSGIATSRPDTGARQLARLEALGLRVGLLRAQRDVDTWSDARLVAAAHPEGRFARAVARVSSARAVAPVGSNR
jgi:glycosyltransferase A (GT-A) superfamily protein (DUF2064 family)